MNFSDMSPAAICEEVGQRLKQTRLNANLAQRAVADRAGISVTAVRSVERGEALLETVVAYLAALGKVEQLEKFVPRGEISPLQLLKLQGKQRQRASRRTKPAKDKGEPEW